MLCCCQVRPVYTYMTLKHRYVTLKKTYPLVGPYWRQSVMSFGWMVSACPSFTVTEAASNGNIWGFGNPPAINTNSGDASVNRSAEKNKIYCMCILRFHYTINFVFESLFITATSQFPSLLYNFATQSMITIGQLANSCNWKYWRANFRPSIFQ